MILEGKFERPVASGVGGHQEVGQGVTNPRERSQKPRGARGQNPPAGSEVKEVRRTTQGKLQMSEKSRSKQENPIFLELY